MNRTTLSMFTLLALAAPAIAQPAPDAAPPTTPEEKPADPPAPAPTPTPTPTPTPAETPVEAKQSPAAAAKWADPSLEEGTGESLQIHGWISQGAMLSTGNNYLAHTKRGSFEFFDTGLNVTQELGSKLRAGIQVFAQDIGPIGNYNPIVDWAYVDYKLRPWLGIRAGHFKMPLFLYSDRLDADMSRTSVLMPQGLYDTHYRSVLAAVSGLDVYGTVELGGAGSIDYDAYVGTLYLNLGGSSDYDVENLAGSRVVWNTPISGLRAAGHFLYSNFHEKYPIDPTTQLTTNYNHWTMAGGGLEYTTKRVTVTAEASSWTSTLTFDPMVQADYAYKQLRGYVQAEIRATDRLSANVYASVFQDRSGGQSSHLDANHQYDTAASVRYDVTPNWIVKAEAHAIEGYAGVEGSLNEGAERVAHWGLFLVKTTLTF